MSTYKYLIAGGGLSLSVVILLMPFGIKKYLFPVQVLSIHMAIE